MTMTSTVLLLAVFSAMIFSSSATFSCTYNEDLMRRTYYLHFRPNNDTYLSDVLSLPHTDTRIFDDQNGGECQPKPDSPKPSESSVCPWYWNKTRVVDRFPQFRSEAVTNCKTACHDVPNGATCLPVKAYTIAVYALTNIDCLPPAEEGSNERYYQMEVRHEEVTVGFTCGGMQNGPSL